MRRLSIAFLPALLLGGCGGDDTKTDVVPCSDTSGSICTWAGTGERGYNGDGLDKNLSDLSEVLDVEFAPDGRAYVLDWNNHRVRRIKADKTFETVIGNDLPGDGLEGMGPAERMEAGLPGLSISLNHPTDLQFLPDGKLLLVAWHNHKIRRFDPETGRVRLIYGGPPGFDGDGGPAATAKLSQPKGAVVTPTGDVYILDNRNQRVRKVAADGTISTVAGNGMQTFAGDGGPCLAASFNVQKGVENPEPSGGVAMDAQGRLYVADSWNHRVRRIDLAGDMVETVAGTGEPDFGGDGGPGTAAKLQFPTDLEIGPDGRLYIADTDNHRVRVLDLTTGVITTFAGTGMAGYTGDGGAAAAATFNRPFGLAFDAAGALYVSDTMNDVIRRIAR